MFTDDERRTLWDEIRQRDLRQFRRFLPDALVRRAAAMAGVRARRLKGRRPRDVLLMDQGFCGYSRFGQVQQRGAFAATRLCPNVTLRTTRRLGYKDRLASWAPADWGRRWRRAGLAASMTLRV